MAWILADIGLILFGASNVAMQHLCCLKEGKKPLGI